MLARIFIWSIPVVTISSCIDAPFEIFMDKKIAITEDHVSNISDEILKQLKNINEEEFIPNYGIVNNINAAICKDAFITWIAEQFRKKRVPKRKIGSEEYGESSTNPNIHHCPTIDIEKEFINAKNKIDFKTLEIKPYSVNLESLRKTLSEKSKCANKFIDPKEHKVTIDKIELIVEKNSINFGIPGFDIYYSVVPVKAKDLKDINNIDKLKKQGSIKIFATTKKMPAEFTGTIPLTMIEDPEALASAQEKISSLQTELITVPQAVDTEIKTEIINDEPYFILPQGEAAISIIVQISARITLGDAFCFSGESKK